MTNCKNLNIYKGVLHGHQRSYNKENPRPDGGAGEFYQELKEACIPILEKKKKKLNRKKCVLFCKASHDNKATKHHKAHHPV